MLYSFFSHPRITPSSILGLTFISGSFAESTITEKDREILKLRMEGYTGQEIADKVGYKTASAVHKRIAKIANAYEDFVTAEYGKYLDNSSGKRGH